jgi:hypothetical protein
MDHPHHAYSALPPRPQWTWPGAARVAVVVLLEVEAAMPDRPETRWAPREQPAWLDVSAWSLHEYGRRAGVFRLGGILDRVGARASLAVSDLALDGAESMLRHARDRDWEFVAHGRAANMLVTAELSEEEERGYLADSRVAVAAATGVTPRGWLGPMMSESPRTPEVAAGLGYDYLLDWGNDDQPYPFLAGDLVSVPVSVDLSDHLVLAAGSALTPWDFGDTLIAHLDGLRGFGGGGWVMTVSLRAHLSGQPFRARHVRRFLEHAAACEDVWFATAGEVVDAYRATGY